MKQTFQSALQLTNVHIMNRIEMTSNQNIDNQEQYKELQSVIITQNNQVLGPGLQQLDSNLFSLMPFKRVQSDVCTNVQQRFKFHPISQVLESRKINSLAQPKIVVPSIILNPHRLYNLNSSMQSNLQELAKNNSKCFFKTQRFQSQNSKTTRLTACTPTSKTLKSFQSRHKAKFCVLGENFNYLQ